LQWASLAMDGSYSVGSPACWVGCTPLEIDMSERLKLRWIHATLVCCMFLSSGVADKIGWHTLSLCLVLCSVVLALAGAWLTND
jgi:hypothetical protein